MGAEAYGDSHRLALKVSETTLGFVVDALIDDVETKALVQMARRLLDERRADYVITGHTHSPCQMLHGRFTNGGCWISNQAVESTSSASDIIFEHGPVDYMLSYVEIGRPGSPRLRKFGQGMIRV